ncbi:hypothetical protein NKH18_47340 [Streptomyces sp. M10(2022)]
MSGHPVDLGRVFEPEARYVRLPGPAWQRQTYWFPETPAGGAAAGAHGRSVLPHAHPMLGSPVAGAGHVWEAPLDLEGNAYVRDHQVQDIVIVPGTASVELVSAAAATVFGTTPAIQGITYHEGSSCRRARSRRSCGSP